MSKKILFTVLTLLFIWLPIQEANAQWGIGATYELRDEIPENGFGLRIDKGILGAIPLVDLGLRAHFSFFSEENSLSQDQITYTTDLKSFDYGLAAYGGVNIGLVKPYVGLGIGSDNYNGAAFNPVQNEFEDFDEQNLYWNLFVGAEVSPIPLIKPFIEYRFTKLFDAEEIDYSQNGRIAIGLKLSF